MNHHITRRTAKARLDGMGMAYQELPVGDGRTVLIIQRGGRVLGPFEGEDGEGYFWMNGAFEEEGKFRKFVEGGCWNLGGERFWVNPELKFFCKTPETFDESYTVQPQLDPGDYTLEKKAGCVRISQSVRLKELGGEAVKAFWVERRYTPAANPLVWMDSLKGTRIDYCGYTQEITLEDLSPETLIPLEPWTLCQVNPGGKFVIPILGGFQFDDYYDPVGEMQRTKLGYVELDVTGYHKYKTAYKSASTFGRIAYVSRFADRWSVMIRNYYNDPSAPYVSEPWNRLGERGCSCYFYNDDGSNGGFGEFEHGGLTIRPDIGCARTINTSSLWFFFADAQRIGDVMRTLLGIDYAFPGGAG